MSLSDLDAPPAEDGSVDQPVVSDPEPAAAESVSRWETPEFQASNDGAGGFGLSIRQLEALQKQAYEEAYAAGIEEGFKVGEQRCRAETARLSALIQQLDRPFETLDESVEKQVVQLALIVARHIIRRELKTEPAHVIGAVRDALAVLPVAARNVRVKLHPKDAELVRKYLQPAEGERAWNIEEDPVLTRGDCLIDTEYSHVDARIESRISTLVATLFGDERESHDTPSGEPNVSQQSDD